MSEYEIAAGRNSRHRRSDAVRGVICDITPINFNFWGPRVVTKNCIRARKDKEDPRQLPQGRTVRVIKNTLRHCRVG